MLNEISYSHIKLSHSGKDCEEKKIKERKKTLILLVRQFLREEGYLETVKQFETEGNIPNQYTICDNVDLLTILQEYESYFYLRFQKLPKIYKKDSVPFTSQKVNRRIYPAENDSGESNENGKVKTLLKPPAKNPPQKKNVAGISQGKGDCTAEFDLKVLPIGMGPNAHVLEQPKEVIEFANERMFKPITSIAGYNDEWKIFYDAVGKEILTKDLNIKWNNIIGLESAKRLLKESVVYPTKYPMLFQGILEPWKALLLFGPPGTGKTMLAKAVASECSTTFFNISASTIVSKWRGDSEKLVRAVFEMARHYAPSTIFFDEIDALASHRDGATEHEATRRMKSELLIQLDGLSHSNDKVFLLATSNLPWELDPAMLRRFEKRILVDVPNIQARKMMFQECLPKIIIEKPALTSNLDYDTLSMKTEDYSGCDIKLVCKEAAMQAVRKVFDALEQPQLDGALNNLKLESINTTNVLEALLKTKPSGSAVLQRYRKWQADCGST